MDEVKNYPPYLDYPKPYKAEVSTDCINRKAFIGKIEKHYCAPCKGQDGDLGGDWCRSCVINSVLEKVREFPAADVVEVRHGRWRWVAYDADPKIGNWHCTYCNRIPKSFQKEDFCPNCGAKMDVEDARKDDVLGQKED